MLLLSAVLVAAVSNLDNLAVGVAFGMRNKRISALPNVIIATVTTAATASAAASGHWLAHLLPPAVASALGSLVIITIGGWTVLASLRAAPPPAALQLARGAHLPCDPDKNNVMACREALALGIALSLNNVASGVGAGVAGLPPFATALLAGAFSLLCVGGGSHAGRSAGRRLLGPRASLAAGVLLLTVGAAVLTGAG
jgi:putative Mn2+ efflux pump MntP